MSAGQGWKPKRCADCGAPHPMFNRDGGKPGTPWRCLACDRDAKSLPADPMGQGSLL